MGNHPEMDTSTTGLDAPSGDIGKASTHLGMVFDAKRSDDHQEGHMVKEGNPIIRNHYTAYPTVIVHEGTV